MAAAKTGQTRLSLVFRDTSFLGTGENLLSGSRIRVRQICIGLILQANRHSTQIAKSRWMDFTGQLPISNVQFNIIVLLMVPFVR